MPLLLERGRHRSRRASANALLGVKGTVELVAVIGYYSFIAMTLNAHEVPLPDGAVPPLPDRAELSRNQA